MKPLKRLTGAIAFPIGTIVLAAMVIALSSGSARRTGLAVLAAAVIGASSASVAAVEGSETAIRPFKFHASDEALADLRRRIAATRWPSRELVTDASQGVQLETMRELASYWQKGMTGARWKHA